MRIAILILILLLSGCAATPITPRDQLPWAAVSAAEAFVARHGFTAIGHPKDLPVQRVEIVEVLRTLDQIVVLRHNMLEPLAFGIQPIAGGKDFHVLFRMIKHPDRYCVVVVKQGIAVQVLHQSYSIEEEEWVPVRH